jgi:5-(carboxyamino)imidazole ribonucleotide synthase
MKKLGIIGGGQLGSMLCQAAKKLDLQTIILTDDSDAPAQNFCDEFLCSDYTTKENLEKFAQTCDVVTFEFENIPFQTLKELSAIKPVFPDPNINKIVQNRLLEKNYVNNLGVKTTKYAQIKNKSDLIKNSSLLPGFLKTTTLGYDGKGQLFLENINNLKIKEIDYSKNYILEKKINYSFEFSIILTRFQNQNIQMYSPFFNLHKNGILHMSTTKIPEKVVWDDLEIAKDYSKKIAEKLNYIGTMCVEFFLDEDGPKLNEIAPRVHNSGHLTIEAYNISQFENHVRAVMNLENSVTTLKNDAVMTNILGSDIIDARKSKYLNKQFFHDYLKTDVKENRKMGHLTELL